MYGLVIENISQYIQERYGIEKWNEIRRLAQIDDTSFNTHTIYPDVYTKNIIDRACQVLGVSDKQFLLSVGESFVIFVSRYGYDIILSCLGREFRDFLNSLDDLHEYLRLSYPRIRPPSYFCEHENEHGLILHYRTKRNFMLWYTVGQVMWIARLFYSTDVEIELLSENQEINEYHFVLQLRFDNQAYLQKTLSIAQEAQLKQNGRLGRMGSISPAMMFAANGGDPTKCPFSMSLPSSPPPPPGSGQDVESSAGSLNSQLMHASVGKTIVDVERPYYFTKQLPPVSVETFLEIFPFAIIYDSSMKIKQTGTCLQTVCPNITHQSMTQMFSLIKPKIEFTWDSILRHTNVTFELKLALLLRRQQNNHSKLLKELRSRSLHDRSTMRSIENRNSVDSNGNMNGPMNGVMNGGNYSFDADGVGMNGNPGDHDDHEEDEHQSFNLQLKGQMMYFPSWKCIAFLGAPNVASVDTLLKTGLYLNDLSMHDFSRDMVLAGQQQSAELKLALDQELHKSRQLETLIKKLDDERKRSDLLLYQMIPKKIADILRSGEKNLEVCQYFPSVTILFSDIMNFTEICSKIAPMQVVNMLNETYTRFDHLTEKHNIYKVETIGDAYMIAGGLPVHQEESSYSHARKVCMMAMDMMEAVCHVKDPSKGRHIKIRIGIHTGPVVGGIVGQKMPRYCLFGDTVNTSSRMETSSLKMKVQISEVTMKLLDPNEWDIRERGTIKLKGKGMMKTFWLSYKKGKGRNVRISDNGPMISTITNNSSLLSIVGAIDGKDRDVEKDFDTTSEFNSRISSGGRLGKGRNSVHDSNYSLFVRRTSRRLCLIL